MLKKTITYTDYNGVERTEDFYFHFNKLELMEMELSTGGLTDLVTKLINSNDVASIINIFKDLVLKAYGEKSADGKRFVKIDSKGNKLANDFAQTEAYPILFMELATDADKAAAFINGIIPADMANV